MTRKIDGPEMFDDGNGRLTSFAISESSRVLPHRFSGDCRLRMGNLCSFLKPLPRQIDIDKVSDEEIQDIVLTANFTPRKCLGFKTSFQAILKELGKDVQIRFS